MALSPEERWEEASLLGETRGSLIPPTLTPRAPSQGVLLGRASGRQVGVERLPGVQLLPWLDACLLPPGLERWPLVFFGCRFPFSHESILILQWFAEQAHISLVHATKDGCY